MENNLELPQHVEARRRRLILGECQGTKRDLSLTKLEKSKSKAESLDTE